MNDFKEWLRIQGRAFLGEGTSQEARLGGREGLQSGLQRLRDKNETYFRICFGLAVVLALCTIVGAILKGGGFVSAAFGLSSAAAVAKTMDAWKEKDRFDTMLELALELDDAALRQVLEVLLKQLK